MRVAFYAPLKAPDHASPSGDRRMARAFAGLLERVGHEVDLACRLRTFDRSGDRLRQQRLRDLARRSARTLVRRYAKDPQRRPDLWFTYHAYHKAPDWLGPTVSTELGIPYIVAEASIAGKQAQGPWQLGHHGTVEGLACASRILAMTHIDYLGLSESLSDIRLSLFPPFLDCATFSAAPARERLARRYSLDRDRKWVVTVAMMRKDVKQQSYRLLADALGKVDCRSWQLLVVGDGPARNKVESYFATFGHRARFLGRLETDELAVVLASSDLMLWPGLREAYGMALLEGQAAGLPVVACQEGGIPDIVQNEATGLLTQPCSASSLAEATGRLLGDDDMRRRMAARAKSSVRAKHDVGVAMDRLQNILAGLTSCG